METRDERDKLMLEVWREMARQAQQHAESLRNLSRLMKEIENIRAKQ